MENKRKFKIRLRKKYKDYRDYSLSLEDELLKSQAIEIRKIYDQKNAPPFEVAFFVFDKYKIWKEKNPACSFNFYLQILVEVGKLKNKESTLKLSFKVARCFPDLRDPVKQRIPFDRYREIANSSRLSQSDMNELRQDAEEYGHSSRKIRDIIKAKYGEETEKEPKSSPFEARITYKTNEQFLQSIKEILEGPAHPDEGAKFLLKKIRR